MTVYEFPYRFHKGVWLPLIPVAFKTFQTAALVDSGASVSLFDPKIGETLGISVDKGKKVYLTGIAGRILAYEHTVTVKIADYEFLLKAAFSYELKVSVNLLGQDNFFDKFIVTFNKSKHVLRLSMR